MKSAFTCLVAITSPEHAADRGSSQGADWLERRAKEHGCCTSGDRGLADPDATLFVVDDAQAALRFALAACKPTGHDNVSFAAGLHGAHASDDGRAPRQQVATLARQLAEATPAGEITLSDAVRRQVEPGLKLPFRRAGALNEKNKPAPIPLWRCAVEGSAAPSIRFGDFEIDLDQFELRRAGARIAVEPRTFDLLALLATRLDRTVTKDEVFRIVWGGRIVSDAALSSQIRAARHALGDDGRTQALLVTIHGRGFRLRAHPHGDSALPAPASAEDVSHHAALRLNRPTVALLPCRNLDEDGRGAIIAQGLTEDLINALTKNRWLRVITRNPVFALGSESSDLATIGDKLGADYILTGSVRRAGSRVRVTMQATDVRTLRCFWSESFDREMRDIFGLQDEISRLVAARLATELGIAEQRKAARLPRPNLGAWELYQLGSAEFYRFTPESNRRCRELMRQAIKLDPEFAEPYSRLAYATILEMVYFDGPLQPSRLDEALTLAEEGVARDDQDANAHFALGRVQLARREYDAAIATLQHAIALNPCHALSYCGLGDSLAYEGEIKASLRQFDEAIRLSPHDPFRWAFMSYRSLAHLFAGQVDDAVDWARRASQIQNAHYWARANLLSALGHLGDRDQIRTARNALTEVRPNFSREFASKRLFYVRRKDQMDTFLKGLKRAGVP